MSAILDAFFDTILDIGHLLVVETSFLNDLIVPNNMCLDSLIDSDEWDDKVMKNGPKMIAISHSMSAI